MIGRLRFLSAVIILVALVMVVRLYFVQIVYSESFVAQAERQNINENTISYDRSDIYFELNDKAVFWEFLIIKIGLFTSTKPS